MRTLRRVYLGECHQNRPVYLTILYTNTTLYRYSESWVGMRLRLKLQQLICKCNFINVKYFCFETRTVLSIFVADISSTYVTSPSRARHKRAFGGVHQHQDGGDTVHLCFFEDFHILSCHITSRMFLSALINSHILCLYQHPHHHLIQCLLCHTLVKHGHFDLDTIL